MENRGILIPDNIIYKTLLNFFNIIRKDWETNSQSESLLYFLFHTDENSQDIDFETFDYFVQAKSLLIDKRVEVNMGYNLENANKACVHIMLPNESGSPLGIGGDENYQPQINTTKGGEDYNQEVFTKRFDSTYQLIITSENLFEVLIIYHYLKSCFISLHYHLELLGLRNLKIGGQDINMQQNLVPKNIFHRTLTLNFFYESNIPNFIKNKIIKQFQITPIIE